MAAAETDFVASDVADNVVAPECDGVGAMDAEVRAESVPVADAVALAVLDRELLAVLVADDDDVPEDVPDELAVAVDVDVPVSTGTTDAEAGNESVA